MKKMSEILKGEKIIPKRLDRDEPFYIIMLEKSKTIFYSEEQIKAIVLAVNGWDELMEANDILGMAEAKSRENLYEAVELMKLALKADNYDEVILMRKQITKFLAKMKEV